MENSSVLKDPDYWDYRDVIEMHPKFLNPSSCATSYTYFSLFSSELTCYNLGLEFRIQDLSSVLVVSRVSAKL